MLSLPNNSGLGLSGPQKSSSYWLVSVRVYLHGHMGLRQNSGMDRPAVIQTYGSVWIICVLVWIGGMDRPVGSGYGSGLYILTRSHMVDELEIVGSCQDQHLMTSHGVLRRTSYVLRKLRAKPQVSTAECEYRTWQAHPLPPDSAWKNSWVQKTGWHNCTWRIKGIKPPVQTAVPSLWCKICKESKLGSIEWKGLFVTM